MDETGNVLDVAIEGKGFFKVIDEEGNQFYTRHGRFQLGKNGTITNQSGLEVVDVRGKGIKVPPNQGMLGVSYDGIVSVGQTKIGQIDFVDIGDGTGQTLNKALTHLGEGLYRKAADPNGDFQDNKSKGLIRQGFIEGSNVNAVHEMTALLSTSRIFEFNQQAIKAMGEMDSQAARDVSRLQG
jgi:flagellar basal body rod protein FlgG